VIAYKIIVKTISILFFMAFRITCCD